MSVRSHRLNIAEFPISELLKIVSNLLESVVQANDCIATSSHHVTLFHSRTVPSIKISAYLSRILKFTPFNNEVLLSILVYFDRISKLRKGKFFVTSLNIHRLLIASVVVASKFTSDVFYPNTRYAKVGGLPLMELNKLEIEFLFLCNFDLHVRLEAMQEYGDQLLLHALTQQTLLVELTKLDKTCLLQEEPTYYCYPQQQQQQRRYQQQQQVVHLPLTPPYHATTTSSEPPTKRRRQIPEPM